MEYPITVHYYNVPYHTNPKFGQTFSKQTYELMFTQNRPSPTFTAAWTC